MGSVREQKMGLSGQKLGSFESNSITLYIGFIYLQRLLRPMLKPVTSLLRVVSEALLLSPS